MKPNQIICGNNIDVVKSWPTNCIDGIVTDPPYGLHFMGKTWDKFAKIPPPGTFKLGRGAAGASMHAGSYNYSRNPEFQQWFTIWAKAMLRITKPGGFLLCFGGTRTFHRLTCAIEDAGWQIRDCMMWLYGSGFPKSTNISLQFDKIACREQLEKKLGRKPTKEELKKAWEDFRKIIGTRLDGCGKNAFSPKAGWHQHSMGKEIKIASPTTDLAQLWDGYGTALKPAWEPIIVAMKPLDGTFAANAEKHGVAGLNIEGGRIKKATGDRTEYGVDGIKRKNNNNVYGKQSGTIQFDGTQGRWPANLLLDEESAKMLDEQSGVSKSPTKTRKSKVNIQPGGDGKTMQKGWTKREIQGHADSGGASRFFYCAKTSRKERNLGLDNTSGKKVNDGRQTPIDNPYQWGETIRQNTHPTVKPLALMKYLCTLLKMPGQNQIILDPFMGSGTTGMACAELKIGFIGIEKESEYCEISQKRITAVLGKTLSINKNAGVEKATVNSIDEDSRPKLPHISEHRQSIINAAASKLRRNK